MPAKKGFILPFVLIAAALAVSAFGYFKLNSKYQPQEAPLVSPTPDPFGNWKAYVNNTYGFTLRYPEQWYIKVHANYAADFWAVDPNSKEATPGAIAIRFSSLEEVVDLRDFEKIYKLKDDETLRQNLDVKSIITKIRNFDVQGQRAIEYSIDRTFSAPEGPRGEYRHIYEIEKGDAVLSFLASRTTKSDHRKLDPIFTKMFSSIKF